ncbi:MAG: LmbE-related protein [uncultured Truepera sp.]|uniref:LmbE-related protein n=1 Tax=uncultured Truepera sp. TaxID=543023 RepID=A0A6J4VKR5_9DEIN|nr:MAG: LmbE-related protein [uncultured Truepera sp.]
MKLTAVFAHPDDELGCIGTLAKHAARGGDVTLVWTTHGELASQFGDAGDKEVRRVRQEHGAWVAKQIGASYHFFDMGDSRMTGGRSEGLALARLYAQLKPDVVIGWSDDHAHPDHRMSAKIAFDAITLARIPKIINEELDTRLKPHRKPVRFYQYPSAGSAYPTVHVDVSDQLGVIERVFAFYRDFYGWDVPPDGFTRGLAARGVESGVEFAEAFQLRRRFVPAREGLP